MQPVQWRVVRTRNKGGNGCSGSSADGNGLVVWIGIGTMIVRVRRHTHRVVGVVPQQRLERCHVADLGAVGDRMDRVALACARSVAAALGTARILRVRRQPTPRCDGSPRSSPSHRLAATIKCWARMGNDWRMAVTDEENQTLITDGMYRHIRHPIYAFSMLLMLCTMVIVPTLPMLAFGAIQIGLWLLKARNEERHLLASHGEAYARYLASTGRFVPRLR